MKQHQEVLESKVSELTEQLAAAQARDAAAATGAAAAAADVEDLRAQLAKVGWAGLGWREVVGSCLRSRAAGISLPHRRG